MADEWGKEKRGREGGLQSRLNKQQLWVPPAKVGITLICNGLPVHPPFAIHPTPPPPCEKKKVWDAGMAETRCKARWNQEKKITIEKSYEPQDPVHKTKNQSHGKIVIYLSFQSLSGNWKNFIITANSLCSLFVELWGTWSLSAFSQWALAKVGCIVLNIWSESLVSWENDD